MCLLFLLLSSLSIHPCIYPWSQIEISENFPQKGNISPERERRGRRFLNVKIFSAGRVDCMKLLLSAGADVDSLDAKVV